MTALQDMVARDRIVEDVGQLLWKYAQELSEADIRKCLEEALESFQEG